MSKFPLVLPSELVDIVIDYLHADVSTLKACNLVCKSWQPRSRYHLFAYLHLDLSLPTKSLQRILLQIAKPNSYFRTSIRDISLRSEVAPQWQHDLSALATLRNLTSISLSNWHNAMPDPYWFHSAFNVTHLEITSCRIDCSGLGVLLRQLPMIESFKLANTSWKDPFDIDRATHCGGLLKHLRKLHLGPRSSSILSAMVALISERIIEGRLEEVELEEVEMRYEMMVADLLAAAGKSLLSLVISAKYRLSDISAAFFHGNINLKSIHFADLVDPSHGHFSFDWVIGMLAELPNSIEHITFSFWLIPGDKLGLEADRNRSINWPKLVQTLGRLRQLTRVMLRLNAAKKHRHWIQRRCEQRFPHLKEVLQVTRIQDE